MEAALGIYAALLSTLVAAVQLVQWRQSRQFLYINVAEMFGDGDSHWEVTISNRGPLPVRLLYAAYGVYSRSLWKPWQVNEESLVSISELIGRSDNDELKIGKPLDGRILQPGDSIHGYVSRRDLDLVAAPSEWRKVDFGLQRCVWIEHSQSDKPAYKLVQLSAPD